MAKPKLETTALDSFLAGHFPLRSHWRALEEGEESRAFAFDSPDGPLVLRVNASAQSFHMDRLAFKVLNGDRIPVPDVLLIEAMSDGNHACVSRRVPGVTLQSLPPGGAYPFAPALAGLLDALADVDTERLNRFADQADRPSWPDFVAEIAFYDWTVCPEDRANLVQRMIERVAQGARHLPHRRGIVHGDFGSNNVLVDAGGVTGLIDWSEAMAGDPLYDVANILFWRSWLDCMEQQARYFEVEQPQRLADRDSLACYQLRIGLATLHGAYTDDDQRLADWVLNRCRAILDNN